MRKAIIFLPAWTSFWIGHLIGRVSYRLADYDHEWLFCIFYKPSSWFLLKSYWMEEWAGTSMIWMDDK